jgi:hypothetical protein
LSTVIRSYRNLIHPGRALRLKETYTAEDAKVAGTLVDIILREVAAKQEQVRGLTAEQITSTSRAIAPRPRSESTCLGRCAPRRYNDC